MKSHLKNFEMISIFTADGDPGLLEIQHPWNLQVLAYKYTVNKHRWNTIDYEFTSVSVWVHDEQAPTLNYHNSFRSSVVKCFIWRCNNSSIFNVLGANGWINNEAIIHHASSHTHHGYVEQTSSKSLSRYINCNLKICYGVW